MIFYYSYLYIRCNATDSSVSIFDLNGERVSQYHQERNQLDRPAECRVEEILSEICQHFITHKPRKTKDSNASELKLEQILFCTCRQKAHFAYSVILICICTIVTHMS